MTPTPHEPEPNPHDMTAPKYDIGNQSSRGQLLGDGGVQVNNFGLQVQPQQPPASFPHKVGTVPAMVTDRLDREIDDVLAQMLPKPGARRSQPRYVLSGMGGVGKTQLAAALANRLWHGRKVDLLVWVTATSREAIVATLAQAQAELTGIGTTDPEAAARQFLSWLDNPSNKRRWLVVFDDLARGTDMQDLWPTTAARRGATIVTTRRRDLQIPAEQYLTIGPFTVAEAEAFLAMRLARHPERLAGAAELAEDLEYLPLALGSAAAFIAADPLGMPLEGGTLGFGAAGQSVLSCDWYRRALADRPTRLVDLLPAADAGTEHYPHTVASAWSISIDLANTFTPAGAAEPLLHIASLLDANAIPIDLFITDAVCSWVAAQTGEAVTAGGVRGLLRRMYGLHLCDFTGTHLRLHALVQHALRDQLSDNQRTRAAVAAADALAEIWPDPETNQITGAVLRTNVLTLLDHANPALLTGGAHPVLFKTAYSFRQHDRTTVSFDFQQALVADCLDRLGADHPDTLHARRELLNAIGIKGDAGTAAGGYLELVADYRERFGEDHPDSLEAAHNLAYWTAEIGNLIEAADVGQQVANMRTLVLGTDHPDTLITRHSLASWRGAAGDVAGAVREAEAVLETQFRVQGADHPNTLATRHNLAGWRGEAGDVAGAVREAEAVLETHLRVMGPAHPNTLATRHNLAYWRGEAGDVAEAIRESKAVWEDRIRVLGADHPNTLATRHNLAGWRGEAGDVAGAIRDYQAVLENRTHVLGADHPDTLTSRHNLARWRGEAGDVAGAVREAEAVLETQFRVLGPDHPNTLATRHNLAYWRGEAGDVAEAVREFKEVLETQLRVLGPDHPNTLTTRHNLTVAKGNAGKFNVAKAELLRLRADCIRVLGRQHSTTRTVEKSLGLSQGKKRPRKKRRK
ncbi:FxSxx-COOH system tetratricopeptide repeat protein [Glycomyces scopariae]